MFFSHTQKKKKKNTIDAYACTLPSPGATGQVFGRVNYNWHFAAKMFFAENVNFCVITIMFLTLAFFSYALWIFERSSPWRDAFE
jgi:hypothetical protein